MKMIMKMIIMTMSSHIYRLKNPSQMFFLSDGQHIYTSPFNGSNNTRQAKSLTATS